ncbi:C-Jun-amino-terminal kinase-interacting protein 4 [Anguilla anguilla]|uniref:C-Jun-amino-terminal kinase-interacting protein 4 n=1 Tax=Anguilla anguilla TaxID=7936 RepID=UPI0015B2A51D|nr:C-Jun-amino-terminal kinase-interacting protein 4 [Anguilla anguilla]
MDCGESVLCAAGEVDLDPDNVSEEAGKLYSELQTVIETHGPDVVESLVPVMVWVLEGLASCRARLREMEEEAEREKGEREELLQRFQSERALKRESQERYLELDDQFEQERRAMRGREKERERRERELEKKAREQADQLLALEEQRTSLVRELNTLKNTHHKLLLSYRDVVEKRKDSERERSLSPLRNHVCLKSPDIPPDQGVQQAPPVVQAKPIVETSTDPAPVVAGDKASDEMVDSEEDGTDPSFIDSIISTTPELAQLGQFGLASTPKTSPQNTSQPLTAEHEPNVEQEVSEAAKEGQLKEQEQLQEQHEQELGEEEDQDSLEWELRNTDSVFSELSELSRDFVESVDRGASVRGSTDQFEEILSQYEELKHTHELVEAARKALISRVEELTNERSALSLEVESCQETITRLEGRTREMEEETKRLRKELEECQSEDESSLPLSLRRFSRSEMARVVMEKNQYKERLIELQEAVRRSQIIRATKEERNAEDRRSGVWTRFNRLFGLTKDPFSPRPEGANALPPSSPQSLLSSRSPRQLAVHQTPTEDSPPAVLSPRARRRELYRDIRSHVWSTLGKRQLHGWSMPLPHATQDHTDPPPEPKDVPVLVQLRLLDQKDATAKLTSATAVTPEISGEQTCSVWVVSGPASSSDVTVIDPARSNTVLDQFSLPPTSPALCLCAVPPTGDQAGTVWIGTQDGSILVHSASTARRRCLQSVSLSEGVHSLTYTQGQVIAGLANGTLAFFKENPGGWDLLHRELLSLGSPPLQPIRCCLPKGAALWVGYWNRVHVIDVQSRKVQHSFSVSERSEQQVRFLCAAGSGVWTSCRLDPCLRLFDWATGRPLQEVDLTPMVTNCLGPAFLSLSPLQISCLALICGRLWVGTGSGAIFSIPVRIGSESSIPYCSLPGAQLCYHGHRQAVKFIISAPGCLNPATASGTAVSTSQLILSGGEGYINFRIGDDGSGSAPEALPQRSERSHMIIWQSSTPSLPSPAL